MSPARPSPASTSAPPSAAATAADSCCSHRLADPDRRVAAGDRPAARSPSARSSLGRRSAPMSPSPRARAAAARRPAARSRAAGRPRVGRRATPGRCCCRRWSRSRCSASTRCSRASTSASPTPGPGLNQVDRLHRRRELRAPARQRPVLELVPDRPDLGVLGDDPAVRAAHGARAAAQPRPAAALARPHARARAVGDAAGDRRDHVAAGLQPQRRADQRAALRRRSGFRRHQLARQLLDRAAGGDRGRRLGRHAADHHHAARRPAARRQRRCTRPPPSTAPARGGGSATSRCRRCGR